MAVPAGRETQHQPLPVHRVAVLQLVEADAHQVAGHGLVLALLVVVDEAGEDEDGPGLVLDQHGGVLDHSEEIFVTLVPHQVVLTGRIHGQYLGPDED